MGILDIFKKKPNYGGDTTNLGLNEDPFKSDPFMDTNSGLNLPQEEYQEPQQEPYNQALGNQFNNSSNQFQKQDPFQKYQQQNQFTQPNNMNQNQPQTDIQKDMQIIIAKLDALRAEVQTINHKIEKIEEKQQKRMW